MTNTSAPMNACVEPAGIALTVDQEMVSADRITYTTVSAAVRTVIQVCSRMMNSKPSTPAMIVTPATTTIATILVPVPPPQPSRSSTVAVARVARMTSTVSQPTVSSQDSTLGSRLPRTPKAARDSTMVGAEPRLPASATQPQSANDTITPTTPAITPCQNDTPNPSTKAP